MSLSSLSVSPLTVKLPYVEDPSSTDLEVQSATVFTLVFVQIKKRSSGVPWLDWINVHQSPLDRNLSIEQW